MARRKNYPENILHDLRVDGATADDLDYSHLTERETAVIQMYCFQNIFGPGIRLEYPRRTEG